MNQKGYTLVEILFALFIGLLLLSSTYAAMTAGQKSSAAVERKITAQQDVRAALEVMSLELGMASFNPNFVLGAWRNQTDCSAAINQVNRGIQEADAHTLTIEMDLGESGEVGDEENEIIRYRYDTASQRITRERILCNGTSLSTTGGVDFLGADPNSGQPRSVRVINQTLGIPVFSYFDGRGSATANIPDIRRIDITLAVETDELDTNTGQRRQMIYASSVLSRNHGITQ